MDLKLRLQRMLQIVEEAERVGALADIERDILLGELREAYAELKFGATENEELPKVVDDEEDPTLAVPEQPEESDEPEVEVELIFDEESDEESDEELEKEESVHVEVSVETPVATHVEEPVVAPVELPTTEDPDAVETTNISDILNLSAPKRSALLSLYEDNPAPVLGEQFRDAPSVADTIACPKGVAESTPVVSLREAIGVADKFMLIRELFGGDADAYEKALDALEAQPSFDDCIIYIAEHYTWSPNAESTKLVMELIQRKYN